jgi:branched-chain amino acid transport system ATP-binding protein
MLEIRDLRAGYSGAEVLHGVDIQIEAGELVAIIGPNGAGKTTLLRVISGLVRPSAGTLRFEGRDLSSMEPDLIVSSGLVHVPEGRMVLGRMTVRENLLLGAHVRSAGPEVSRDLEYVLTLFPRLEERLEQMAGTLSGGEQQMLAIGRGLMGSPRLLMLDEPSLGIAPIMVEKIFAAIQDIRARGVTVLLVEQNAAKALDLAIRGYALDLGHITSAGRSTDLLNDDRVRQAYLGI